MSHGMVCVNAPGHFLVRYKDERTNADVYIDPFNHGKRTDLSELAMRLAMMGVRCVCVG